MFIVIEGIDGSGKSTQASRLAERMRSGASSREVVLTREPGGWDDGEYVRSIIFGHTFSHELSELLLFMHDRCEHAARVIAPAIDRGAAVVCDRYTPSTLAYQVLSNDALSDDQKEKLLLVHDAASLPEPNVVVWLDLSVEDAYRRVVSRGAANSFDKRGREYFTRVRAAYERMYEADDGRTWIRIDASAGEDEVFEMMVSRISRAMGERI